ncbi:MAG: hypothetical protein D6717_10405 [Gammaproteobacteria bacterium]|nr:MAG: hypothetical protein D6717_10405 [Gammaproteobacteria bacterium]
MHPLLTALAMLAYLLTTALVAVQLRGRMRNGTAIDSRLLLGTWLLALILHGVALWQAIVTPEGLDLGFFRALSAVGWMAAALLLVSCFGRVSISLGLVLLPFAGISAVLAGSLPEISFIAGHPNARLDLHIFISLLAYSVLTLATLQALLLAYQIRHLHNHQPGGLLRVLPPLAEMEHLLFRFILLGFILLTIALASGFVYLEDMFAQHVVHKTILSIAAWFIYGVLLFGHWRFGWRGRLAVNWTLGAFVVLMLAYFGSKLVLELILGRGGAA